MQEEEKKEIKAINKQLKIVADVIGRTASPIIGMIAAGPIGAIAGGVVGTLIKYGTEEFLSRFLTPKEVRRVGTSAEYIVNEINSKLAQNEKLNEDLFQKAIDGSSDAEELFEGVLLKAKNEYQQKKLKYISSIFVNAVFYPSMSSSIANQILNIAESLTYQEICLISLIGQNQNNKFGLRLNDNRPEILHSFPTNLNFLIRDLRHLADLGIMRREDRMGLNNYTDPAPGKLILSTIGKVTFHLMNLSQIPTTDFTFIEILK